jgi:DNA-binding MarR family transcriptional regulator
MKKGIVSQVRAFNRFYTGVIGVLNNHILESPYSLAEVRVMYEVYHDPKITARQLKGIMQVDEGYLSRLIARLVSQKIISKVKSKEDNRISILTLTKNGREIFLQLNQRSDEAASNIVHHLDKEEQRSLIAHFQSIKQLLTKNNR